MEATQPSEYSVMLNNRLGREGFAGPDGQPLSIARCTFYCLSLWAVLVLRLELLLLSLLLLSSLLLLRDARSVAVVNSQVAKPNWSWSGGSTGPGGNTARTDGRVFGTPRESEPGPSEANTSV